jgi:hypothetical protein
MKKKLFILESATSSVLAPTFETTNPAEKHIISLSESKRPTPPSEETIARLNAIAREYPFCAYMKQTNLYLL